MCLIPLPCSFMCQRHRINRPNVAVGVEGLANTANDWVPRLDRACSRFANIEIYHLRIECPGAAGQYDRRESSGWKTRHSSSSAPVSEAPPETLSCGAYIAPSPHYPVDGLRQSGPGRLHLPARRRQPRPVGFHLRCLRKARARCWQEHAERVPQCRGRDSRYWRTVSTSTGATGDTPAHIRRNV